MSHRYYSPLRPLSLGTFPKPQGNEILHIENFEETQVIKGNGRNTKQGLIDAAEMGKHFDTAIDAMTMLLAGRK